MKAIVKKAAFVAGLFCVCAASAQVHDPDAPFQLVCDYHAKVQAYSEFVKTAQDNKWSPTFERQSYYIDPSNLSFHYDEGGDHPARIFPDKIEIGPPVLRDGVFTFINLITGSYETVDIPHNRTLMKGRCQKVDATHPAPPLRTEWSSPEELKALGN